MVWGLMGLGFRVLWFSAALTLSPKPFDSGLK